LETLLRIEQFEGEKTYRPTVVVPIIDYAGRPLLVRHNTKEQNWGLVQGHIENFDADPVAACRRECYEEAEVTDEKIECVYPYLHDQSLDLGVRSFTTGFSKGGYYVCVGLQLKAGADVSVIPPRGFAPSLLERTWCPSLDAAIALLREQPGATESSFSMRLKVEQVLIPALESMYQPHVRERSETINYDYI
jgi:hypothetical protein